MRKLIVIFLFLFSYSTSFSQDVVKVYKVISGPYNPYTNEFETETNYVNMHIIFDGNVIRISDVAHSVYITRNPELREDDYRFKIISFDAVDEKSRNCKIFISINKVTDEQSLSIAYNEFIFQYMYK